MTFQGIIENGVVVFSKPVPLANGTQVRVEAVPAVDDADFWHGYSVAELARLQGVSQPRTGCDEFLGGWPTDELEDGFEEAVRSWRDIELGHGR